MQKVCINPIGLASVPLSSHYLPDTFHHPKLRGDVLLIHQLQADQNHTEDLPQHQREKHHL